MGWYAVLFLIITIILWSGAQSTQLHVAPDANVFDVACSDSIPCSLEFAIGIAQERGILYLCAIFVTNI